MNIEEFIRFVKKRPLMYIEALRLEHIYHLLTGFHLGNVSNNNDVESFYWHHFIKDITESEEEAIELFFQLSEQFFEEYHNNGGFAADFLLDD